MLDGQSYPLTRNDGPHQLHGGTQGFSYVVWQAEPVAAGPAPAVKFTYRSPDGDQGYPGGLDVAVVYTLTDDNALRIDATAASDRPTLVDLTHHSYFNLAGAGSGDVLKHAVGIDADRWLPDTPSGVPSGEIASVTDTPYDFTQPMALGARIQQAGGEPPGYDLCYLHNHGEGTLACVATVFEPSTGRRMEVLTTEPAIVLYTANYLDGSLAARAACPTKDMRPCAWKRAARPTLSISRSFPRPFSAPARPIATPASIVSRRVSGFRVASLRGQSTSGQPAANCVDATWRNRSSGLERLGSVLQLVHPLGRFVNALVRGRRPLAASTSSNGRGATAL